MNKIFFKKCSNAKKGIKAITIRSKAEDKESVTSIRKYFLYTITPVALTNKEDLLIEHPEIYIRKRCDTKKRVEKFHFRVKGYFYMTYNRRLIRVEFQHFLFIHIDWKKSIFSPKKSEILT